MFLKKNLKGVKCPFFEVFGLFCDMALRMFPSFYMFLEDNRVHPLREITFLKKKINPGLYVIKCPFFFFSFLAFSPKLLQGTSQFCMIVEDNRGNFLSLIAFINKFSSRLKRNKCQIFKFFLLFSPKQP